MVNEILCPVCEEAALIVDLSNPLGVRRANTAGCIRQNGNIVIVQCCHCGGEWNFARVCEVESIGEEDVGELKW